MAVLSSCCCCVPLRWGCWIIAVILIINNVGELGGCKLVFDHLGPQPNEDEENKNQRQKVLVYYIFRVAFAVGIIVMSVAVIYATMERIVALLKIAAYVVAGLEMTQTVAKVILYKASGMQWLLEIGLLVLNLYFCVVWYSYAEFIEEGGETAGFVTVTVDPSTGQQTHHVIPPAYTVFQGRAAPAPVTNTGQPPPPGYAVPWSGQR